MTVAEALEKISKALAVLAYQTRAENLGGMFSKNRLTEDLLMPVFRFAFAAPQLRNVNQATNNFPSIDLADENKRLAIQVTTEAVASKVSTTLTTFIENGYSTRYDRLIVFLLRDEKPRYVSKTTRHWADISGDKLRFDPHSDIIAILGLFKLVEGLPPDDIYAIEETITRSVVGEKYLDVESLLTRQSRRQLEYEKKTGKYIPDIFVETRELKNLARHFTHPVLFFQRTLELVERASRCGPNRLLQNAGLPPLPYPEAQRHHNQRTLSSVEAAAAALSGEFDPLFALLSKYESAKKERPPFPIKKGREAYYEQNTYTLQNLGWSIKFRLRDELDQLLAATARVFILSGRAGQGKTNFVCDFVEKFLWKHQVPCAYISARRLGAIQSPDIGDTVQRLIFDGQTSSFGEAAKLLNLHAQRVGKPFVLVIDGLNEHHRINEFAEQLEQFIEATVDYPGIRLLLTCRSEFFQQRFGNLVKGPIGKHSFLYDASERRSDDEFFEEVLVGYFKFFKLQRDLVSDHAIKALRGDILLLRFFCEAYGARGKPSGYQQPFIADIYREQIFEIYLERKLGTADAFLRLSSGTLDPSAPKANLRAVLEVIVEHMVATWRFSDVPAAIVPASLNPALYALLDEELILRRDLSPPTSIFSPSAESINFTFDEFRDYLIAQYLIHRTFASDRSAFQQFISRNEPAYSQILEGIKRFLFYGSRRPENADFWQFYRATPWYAHVYDAEVFNVDQILLGDEDREIVISALQNGGERAERFSRALAVHWRPESHSVLGLNLLLEFVSATDNEHFDTVIMATFRSIQNLNEGASAKAFCEFVANQILPQHEFVSGAPEHGLFRFLVLLLPVNSDARLDSAADAVFRVVMSRATDYAIDLLIEALGYRPTRHRPHVWRLLTSAIGHSPRIESLVRMAEQDRAAADGSDPILHREANRFIERCLESPTPA